MPGDNRRPPETYDDIVRRTVPDPDSSWRPGKQGETQAMTEGLHHSEDEQALRERVMAAITGASLPVKNLAITVERSSVTVRGSVGDPGLLRRVEELIHGVEGVGDVRDDLIVEQGA